jgi:hypothetical protein
VSSVDELFEAEAQRKAIVISRFANLLDEIARLRSYFVKMNTEIILFALS